MKLWIPKCGDAATLDADWSFELKSEHRNNDLYDKLKGVNPSDKKTGRWHDSHGKPIGVTFPTGTELVFDRIYIRQGKGYDAFASVTFMIKLHQNDDLIGERFWVSLEEANKMELTPTTKDNPVGGFAKQRYKSAVRAKKDPAAAKIKAAKAKKSKAAQAELEHVRAACRLEVLKVNGHNSQHVEDIITQVVNASKSRFASAGYCYPIDTRERVRQRMSWDASRFSVGPWRVVSTRVLPDGSSERDVSYNDHEKRFDGFTVTMKDSRVTAIVPFKKAP